MTEASMSNNEPLETQDNESIQNNGAQEATEGSKQEVVGDNSQTQVEALEAKVAELNDKMLRAVAEAQNTKRRAQIDVENASKYSIERFAKDMIAVLDNLFRASESIDKANEEKENPQLKAIHEGIELTKNEMINALRRNGIERVEPLDQMFDHNLHQAMAQVPNNEKKEGTVIDVMQAGYTIKGRLLRPALVAIAKAPESQTPQADNNINSGNDIPEIQEF